MRLRLKKNNKNTVGIDINLLEMSLLFVSCKLNKLDHSLKLNKKFSKA